MQYNQNDLFFRVTINQPNKLQVPQLPEKVGSYYITALDGKKHY